jgi:hypothetical protein
VDQSFLLHIRAGGTLNSSVPFKIQTQAAQNAGKKNLSELEGISRHGAQLTRLLLGLGRIFGVLAEEPCRHAPETNQFYITDEVVTAEVDEILKAAVMHLAVLRQPGNKLADESDTREYDYMVHPIFSAFFVFSYRRKRKISLTCGEILGLIQRPNATVEEVLSRHHVAQDLPLPQQLSLFKTYYDGDSR